MLPEVAVGRTISIVTLWRVFFTFADRQQMRASSLGHCEVTDTFYFFIVNYNTKKSSRLLVSCEIPEERGNNFDTPNFSLVFREGALRVRLIAVK